VPHSLTILAFVIHIAGGAIGLVSGTLAVCARKGGNLHRKAGSVFVVSTIAWGSHLLQVRASQMGLHGYSPALTTCPPSSSFRIVPLGLMVFWMIRVRSAGWHRGLDA